MGSDRIQLKGDSSPIGIFDSGLGGLTVLKELIRQYPNEPTIYFGDSGRTPYGTKSKETIIRYAISDAAFLMEQGVKLIVIACNTASAYAADTLSDTLSIPVLEVIGPGALRAVQSTRNGKIGVIGTPATVKSDIYRKAIQKAAACLGVSNDLIVLQRACPLFVGLAEEGWWNNEIALLTAREYLKPLKDANVDTLVLGCTHYPILQEVIGKTMGDHVMLINSAGEVVRKIGKLLESGNVQAANSGDIPAKRLFYTSDSEEKFTELGSVFLGLPIPEAQRIEIEKY
jgi:glutamate racemase